MMTKTQFNNAKKVWDAFTWCIWENGRQWGSGIATNKQISERAKLSVPTVRRYMKMAQSENRVIWSEIRGLPGAWKLPNQ